MSYGTIRKKTEDAILSTLQKHEKLRYTELQNIIIHQLGICSERIFRESLDTIVGKGIVKKFEIARNNIIYSINSEILMIKDEDIKKMMDSFMDYKDVLDEIKNIISSDASDIDKATEIKNHLKFLAMHEIQVMMLSYGTGKSALTKHVNEISKLKKDIISMLIKKGSNEFDLVTGLIYSKFFVEILSESPDHVNQFLDGVKKFQNTRSKR